jgi:hypothetical protein
MSFGEWFSTFQDMSGITGPTKRCCIQEDLNSKKHRCANHNSYIKSAVLHDIYGCRDVHHVTTELQRSPMEQATQQMYNVKLPTVLLYTEFTLVLLTNYIDLISAGVTDNCGYRTSSGIVNVGVNIHMTKLSYNTHHTQY